MTKKIVIGLTGTFGSGKSTVAKMFKDLGAKVVDADQLAHEALCPGSLVFGQVASLFKEAKTAKGELDRKAVARVVFKDAKKRKKLESLVHPYVFQRILAEIAEAREPVIVLEVPLLFETGFDQLCRETIVVAADEKEIERRLAKDGFAPDEIRARQKAQLPLEEKMWRAHSVIRNSSSLEETRHEVEEKWNQMTGR